MQLQLERASILARSGKLKKARAILKSVIAREPGNALAIETLGIVRLRMDAPREALALLERASALNPDSPSVAYNAGLACLGLHRLQDARDHLERSLALEPGVGFVHMSLSEAYEDLGDLGQAVRHLEAALRQPDSPDAAALGRLIRLKRKICDWDGIAALEEGLLAALSRGEGRVRPFLLTLLTDDPYLQLRNARNYAAASFGSAGKEDARENARAGVKRPEGAKLRIGYLSANFFSHPTAYNVAGLLELHDRARFEIVGLSAAPDDGSDIRRRVMSAFDVALDLRDLTPQACIRRIRNEKIDILVEMNGFTRGSALPLLRERLAPVQIHYRAFPGTIGCDFLDYLIADPVVAPAADAFSESLIYMPDCYWVTDRVLPPLAPSPPRSALGLPEDGFVFACLNTSHKLSPAVFDVWAALLKALPRSVLWLLEDNVWVAENLRGELRARGLDPDRLVFAEKLARDAHLARLQAADLALDTFPYGAHTSMIDALAAGLPMLTCAGRSFASRAAASMLTAIGLERLIASTLDGYRRSALELAGDPGRLTALRELIARNQTARPLFDAARFCRCLEAAYRETWRLHEAGEPPRDIHAGALDALA